MVYLLESSTLLIHHYKEVILRLPRLTFTRRKLIESQVAKQDTEELPAILSRNTIQKIQKGIPVSYRSAALYCKSVGLDPYTTIILEKRIPILDPLGEGTPA